MKMDAGATRPPGTTKPTETVERGALTGSGAIQAIAQSVASGGRGRRGRRNHNEAAQPPEKRGRPAAVEDRLATGYEDRLGECCPPNHWDGFPNAGDRRAHVAAIRLTTTGHAPR